MKNEFNIKYFNNGNYVKFDEDIIWHYNIDNEIHRDNDFPAIIAKVGTLMWYKQGKLHRDDDLPAIIFRYNFCQWYVNDIFIKSEFNRIYRCENIINYNEELQLIYNM